MQMLCYGDEKIPGSEIQRVVADCESLLAKIRAAFAKAGVDDPCVAREMRCLERQCNGLKATHGKVFRELPSALFVSVCEYLPHKDRKAALLSCKLANDSRGELVHRLKESLRRSILPIFEGKEGLHTYIGDLINCMSVSDYEVNESKIRGELLEFVLALSQEGRKALKAQFGQNQYLQEAFDVASEIEKQNHTSEIERLLGLGRTNEALVCAFHMDRRDKHGFSPLGKIIPIMIQYGCLHEAICLARSLPSIQRSKPLCEIMRALTALGRFEEVIPLANEIRNLRMRNQMLNAIDDE